MHKQTIKREKVFTGHKFLYSRYFYVKFRAYYKLDGENVAYEIFIASAFGYSKPTT